MKRLILTYFLVSSIALVAQETAPLPRAAVTVDGGANPGPRIESLMATIRSTLELSLSLSGEISLVDSPEAAEFLFAVEIAEEAGTFRLKAEQISRIEESRVALSERTAESIFDVFAVVDNLTLDIVRTLSDADVAFGSLLLENRGFGRPYEVRIDGVAVGSNLNRIDRILTGPRTITVAPPAGSGESAYLREEIVVSQAEPVLLSFWVPPFGSDAGSLLRAWHRAQVSSHLGEAPTGESPDREELLAIAPDLTGRTERLSARFLEAVDGTGRLREPAWARLLDSGVIDAPRNLGPRATIPRESPERRILKRIPPVSREELPGWRWQIVGNRNTPPLAIDPSGDSPTELEGSDFHEVYALRSEAGIHLVVTFHDGTPSTSNGHYRIGFATEHVESGLIEVMWRNESGRPDAVVARVTPQRWTVLESFSAPTEFQDGVLVFTIPESAMSLARSRAKGVGWEFTAVLEIGENGSFSEGDSINVREARLYF